MNAWRAFILTVKVRGFPNVSCILLKNCLLYSFVAWVSSFAALQVLLLQGTSRCKYLRRSTWWSLCCVSEQGAEHASRRVDQQLGLFVDIDQNKCSMDEWTSVAELYFANGVRMFTLLQLKLEVVGAKVSSWSVQWNQFRAVTTTACRHREMRLSAKMRANAVITMMSRCTY